MNYETYDSLRNNKLFSKKLNAAHLFQTLSIPPHSSNHIKVL